MNIKRILIIYIAIVITAATLLILKNLRYEDAETIEVTKEPLPVSVTLKEYIGSTPEADRINVLFSDEQIDLLARLIQAEAGSDWCTDELQRGVGSVVINRMNDSRYPDTMHDVIYQPGQYSPTKSGAINNPATVRARANAEYVIHNGSTLPDNVLFQAQFIQADGVYKKIGNQYFCYKE